MILHAAAEGLRLVTQNDHAHFAAELLRLWRADGLPNHPRRQALLTAIREHDNGWREADSAPRIQPSTGKPLGFAEIPDTLRLEIWRTGMLRYRDEDPLVALYIAEHALALHLNPDGTAPTERPDRVVLVQEARGLKDDLLEEAGVDPDDLATDYRFLKLADRLSLVVSGGWPGEFEVDSGEGETLRGAYEPGRLLLAPFPLAGTTTFRLPCRFVPDRIYTDGADLAVELATARWTEAEVRVAPLSAG